MKNDQSSQLVKVEEIDTGYEDEQLDYENLDELEEGTGFIFLVFSKYKVFLSKLIWELERLRN